MKKKLRYLSKNLSHLPLKLPPECRKLKLRNRLTKWNKKLEVHSRREKLKMKPWLKRIERNYITFKLSVNPSKLQVKQRQRPKLFLKN